VSLASLKNAKYFDRMASERLLSRGETIFRKGQPAKQIYKVEVGCVRTFMRHKNGRRLIVAFYFPGDYFGLEMRKLHHVSAQTITPSKILLIKRKPLISRATTDVAIANRMLDLTNLELQRAQRHSLLLRISSSERVWQFLLEMKKRNQSKRIDLLMSRQDIADYLSLTVESVARALTRLKNVSAISIRRRRHIVVHMRTPLAA
jgi:CRP/FNR family transcriptional regulator, nitrogen fixation regulation protein